MAKTRATTILEQAGIPFDLGEFEAIVFTAQEVADKLAMPLPSVFKTLVVRGERVGPLMAVVPGDKELSLKKLAQAAGDRRVDLVKLSELEKLTGYLKGGCSPLGSKREMHVYIDSSIKAHPRVAVSAGLRGLQLLISPDNLIQASKASLAEIAE